MEKTITVIMPLYNYARFLPEALDSLMAQSVKPDEIIIVDDGSTDNPKPICDKYPVKYIYKENGGLASARNRGIQEATSDYVFSFDADDILRPDTIKEYKALAEPNTIVTLPLMAFGSESYTARPEHASLELLKQRNVIYSNSLFPKELWERVGGFDESETMRLGLEDWLFWMECAKVGAKFKTGDYLSLLWRRHPKSMSESSANPNWDKITKYMLEKITDH
jgi:glycosyltransferase involved in cell wall biosynthesis